MNPPPLTKVAARTAAEICRRFDLKSGSREFLTPEQTPWQFFELLTARKKWADAVQLLAYGLPRREAVWWGCLAVWLSSEHTLAAPALTALRAATRWVIQPTEEQRRALHQVARAARTGTAANLIATAAIASGGSLLTPDLPVVAPQPTLTARLVSGGIILAAAQGKPTNSQARYRQCVALGVAIAQGKISWPAPPD